MIPHTEATGILGWLRHRNKLWGNSVMMSISKLGGKLGGDSFTLSREYY